MKIIKKLLVYLVFLGMKRKYSFSRHGMYKRLEACVPHKASKLSILSISGSQELVKVILSEGQEHVVNNIEYPEYDVCNLTIQGEMFDVVACDQVIEHVKDPHKAIENMAKVLKPGGVLVVTSCFVNLYHPAPNDYWRFSEEAYALMCQNCDELKLIKTGKAGNLLQTILFELGLRKQRVPHSSLHPLTLISQLPAERHYITSWFIAEKYNG